MAIGWALVENARYSNAEGTAIDCDVTFSHLFGEAVPFTALANDSEPHGRELFAELKAGKWGVIAAFVPPPVRVPQSVTALQARRALRAAGLMDNVKTVLASADEETKEAWEYAGTFRRDDAILKRLARQMSLSDKQIDALFIAASKIV